MVSASYGETLKVWGIGSGGAVAAGEDHTSAATACAVKPDGRHVVSEGHRPGCCAHHHSRNSANPSPGRVRVGAGRVVQGDGAPRHDKFMGDPYRDFPAPPPPMPAWRLLLRERYAPLDPKDFPASVEMLKIGDEANARLGDPDQFARVLGAISERQSRRRLTPLVAELSRIRELARAEKRLSNRIRPLDDGSRRRSTL